MGRVGRAQKHFLETVEIDTDECIVWPHSVDKDGYGIFLSEGRQRRVHVEACMRKHGPRPVGMYATHGPCNTRRCYNPRHLSWGTPLGNMRDRIRDLTVPIGEGHHGAVLDEAAVRRIRIEHSSGASLADLGRRYGVNWSTIRKVVHRITWAHVQ